MHNFWDLIFGVQKGAGSHVLGKKALCKIALECVVLIQPPRQF